MPLEWHIRSRFNRSPERFFAHMMDGAFQEDMHVKGLKMTSWDYVDRPAEEPGGVLTRVAFAEPKLNLPAVIQRLARKTQAYHELSSFEPMTRVRHVTVKPLFNLIPIVRSPARRTVRPVIHHTVYWCSPRHSPHSVPVLASSSTSF